MKDRGGRRRLRRGPQGHHRAQGRPAPAGHHRGRGTDHAPLSFYPIPEKAHIEVDEAQKVRPERCSPRRPARSPERRTSPVVCRASPSSSRPAGRRTPAVMAEIDGIGRDRSVRRSAASARSSSRTTTRASSREHTGAARQAPPGAQRGDRVEAGDPLVDGPLIPQDILRIHGEPRPCRTTCCAEVQSVYRSQNVSIDDKHIEIIVSQMLRQACRSSDPGDTDFLPDAGGRQVPLPLGTTRTSRSSEK